jgi:zinc protease
MYRPFHVIALLLIVAGFASAQPSPTTLLKLDPSVTAGKLPNGITYFIRVNHKPEKRMELRLAVNAGSVLEDDDQQGIAHLNEHMAFNGSKNFPKQDLVKYLESIGVNFGADLNAYTSFDETVYMLLVPTETDSVMERGMQVMEDWAHLCTYDDDEINKERGVVIEEWRLGQGAGQRIQDKELPVLMNGSRYAVRLPIGKKEVLENTATENVRRFYKTWYRPDLMAIVAVGDFDKDKMEALIKSHFGNIPAVPNGRPRLEFDVPEHDMPLAVSATDKEQTESSVGITFKFAPTHTRTVGDFRHAIVERVVAGMANERLRELSEQADPPFFSARASKGSWFRGADMYALDATVKDNGWKRGLEAIVTEAARMQQHGFNASELERQKISLLRGYEKRYAEREKSESRSFAGQLVSGFLRNEPAMGIEQESEYAKALVPSITLDDVNNEARALVPTKNLVLSSEMPEKEGVTVPTESELIQTYKETIAKPVVAYNDNVVDKPLVSKAPAAGTIVSEKKRDAIGVTEWTLSNGVRVILKPTEFKNDEVLLGGFAPGGSSLASDADFIPAMSADEVISECGLGEFSPSELRKQLTGKVASAGLSIGELYTMVRGNASPKDMKTMFELAYLRMTAPRMDETQFTAYMERQKAELANKSSEPQSVWSDTIAATLGNYHPRRMPMSEATLAKFNLKSSYEFYRSRTANAADYTFVLVGNFSLDGIKPLVTTYLGGLPSAGTKTKWRDLGIQQPKGQIEKVVYKGVDQKSMVMCEFNSPFVWSPKEIHDARATTQAISMRLLEVLREDKSGVYFVFLSGQPQHEPRDEMNSVLMFGCSPDRVEELRTAAYQIIDSIRDNGMPANLIERVRQTELREREVSMKQNNFWIGVLQTYYQTGTDPDLILQFPTYAKEFNAETAHAMAKKYLTRENCASFVLKPEKK